MDIHVVYNEDSQRERLEETFKESPFSFTFIDVRGKDKKNAWALKSHWAAKQDPFAVVKENDKVIKAFYSETGEDIIDSLIKFLQS